MEIIKPYFARVQKDRNTYLAIKLAVGMAGFATAIYASYKAYNQYISPPLATLWAHVCEDLDIPETPHGQISGVMVFKISRPKLGQSFASRETDLPEITTPNHDFSQMVQRLKSNGAIAVKLGAPIDENGEIISLAVIKSIDDRAKVINAVGSSTIKTLLSSPIRPVLTNFVPPPIPANGAGYTKVEPHLLELTLRFSREALVRERGSKTEQYQGMPKLTPNQYRLLQEELQFYREKGMVPSTWLEKPMPEDRITSFQAQRAHLVREYERGKRAQNITRATSFKIADTLRPAPLPVAFVEEETELESIEELERFFGEAHTKKPAKVIFVPEPTKEKLPALPVVYRGVNLDEYYHIIMDSPPNIRLTAQEVVTMLPKAIKGNAPSLPKDRVELRITTVLSRYKQRQEAKRLRPAQDSYVLSHKVLWCNTVV